MTACSDNFTQLLKSLHLIFISKFVEYDRIFDLNIKFCKRMLTALDHERPKGRQRELTGLPSRRP